MLDSSIAHSPSVKHGICIYVRLGLCEALTERLVISLVVSVCKCFKCMCECTPAEWGNPYLCATISALCVCVLDRESFICFHSPESKLMSREEGNNRGLRRREGWDGEKERYRECRGWGFGWRGSCVREAQLGNEKCNPPPPHSPSPSPYHHLTLTHMAHTYRHTRSPSLYPPLRKDGVEVVVVLEEGGGE